MDDETKVEANVEERNFTDIPKNQKPSDERGTVQSYVTCTSQNPISIHLEQHHLQYLDSYNEISRYVQPTGRNTSSNQFPSYIEYEYDPSDSQALDDIYDEEDDETVESIQPAENAHCRNRIPATWNMSVILWNHR